MSERHGLRKMRILQREVEDALRAVLADEDRFGVQKFGEGQYLVDADGLKGLMAYAAGRWEQALKGKPE